MNLPHLAATALPPLVPRDGADGMMVLVIQLVMFAAIFYFLLIRPQRRERQRHQQMLSKLAKGDRVMTNGGILGEVVHATPAELTIRTGENTRIVLDRAHVARKIVESGTSDSAAKT